MGRAVHHWLQALRLMATQDRDAAEIPSVDSKRHRRWTTNLTPSLYLSPSKLLHTFCQDHPILNHVRCWVPFLGICAQQVRLDTQRQLRPPARVQTGQIPDCLPVFESSASPCAARRKVNRSTLSGSLEVKLFMISTSRHTCIEMRVRLVQAKVRFQNASRGIIRGGQRFPTWQRIDSASPEGDTSVLQPPGGVSASASLRLWPFLSPVSDPLLIAQRNPGRAGQRTCPTGHLGRDSEATLRVCVPG